jgi:hypothetical protein
VFVHSWVATLADLLWVGFGLGIAALVRRGARDAIFSPLFVAAIGTAGALLAKEAALALTPLLALAWWLSGRERRWLAATAGSLLPTLIYLGLRLPVLLFPDRPPELYSWSPTVIPIRWAEAMLFPWMPTQLDLYNVANSAGWRLAWASGVALALIVCTWRASPRLALVYVAGGAIAFGPTLTLQSGSPQYGYGYSVLACVCLALAWPRLQRTAQGVLLFAVLISTWHGFNMQREFRRIGQLQAQFSPALAAHLRRLAPDARVRLWPEQDRHVYQRLTTAIPHYRGVVFGERVLLASSPDQADLRIAPDGSLHPNSH